MEECTLFIRIPKFFVELEKPLMFLGFEPMIVLKLFSSVKGLQIKGINILNIVAIVQKLIYKQYCNSNTQKLQLFCSQIFVNFSVSEL